MSKTQPMTFVPAKNQSYNEAALGKFPFLSLDLSHQTNGSPGNDMI